MKPKGQAAEVIWSDSLQGVVVNAKLPRSHPANSAHTLICNRFLAN